MKKSTSLNNQEDYLDYVDELRRIWQAQPKEISAATWARIFPEFEDNIQALRLGKLEQKFLLEEQARGHMEGIDELDEDLQLWRAALVSCQYGIPIAKLEKEIKYLDQFLAALVVKECEIDQQKIELAKSYPLENLIVGKPKKTGHRIFFCCPFHQEKTPSFCIDTNKNRYTCYGCNAYGSVIDFVMKTQSIGFIPAVKYLLSLWTS